MFGYLLLCEKQAILKCLKEVLWWILFGLTSAHFKAKQSKGSLNVEGELTVISLLIKFERRYLVIGLKQNKDIPIPIIGVLLQKVSLSEAIWASLSYFINPVFSYNLVLTSRNNG